MSTDSTIVVVCWMIFLSYWAVSAFSAKKNKNSAWRFVAIRAVIIIVIFLLFHSHRFNAVTQYNFIPPSNTTLGFIGALFTLIGIGVAIWARYHLGQNWGMSMSVKENADLVESGPYKYVRHPIYTGILLAILGSALVSGTGWLLIFIVAAVYFIYSATQEEKIMSREFPLAYNAYKKKTKMLIPFIY